MKKTLLYSILALGLIAASVGGYVYYIINMKTYDTADKKVTEITEEEYKIDLPSDSATTDAPVPPSENTSTDNDDPSTDSESKSNQEPSASSTENEPENATASTQPTSSTSPNNHSQPKPKKVTVQQIKNNYRPVFQSLQTQANGRLSALVGHAESEYSTKKANGEKIRIGYFVSKYKSAGENLEAKTDQTFNTIYSALKNDLKRNGFDTKHAAEFKTQYENEKEARRNSLYSQVKDRL
jgi:ABC-type cobalt transport system substrate-binding protein